MKVSSNEYLLDFVPENVDRIGAFMDAQGFMVDHLFCVREISIESAFFSSHIEIKSEFTPISDCRLNYQTRYVHGLTLHSDTAEVSCRDLDTVIYTWYDILKNKLGSDVVVAVKNHQLSKILTSLKVPHIDLNDHPVYSFPKLWELDEEFPVDIPFCSLHIHVLPELRCSRRKAFQYFNYIKHHYQSE